MINIGIDLASSHNIFFGDGMWTKYTLTYSDLAAAAATNSVVLTSLPAKRVLQGVLVKHSVAFGGGAITGYTLSVGLAASSARYASTFSVFSAPSSSNMRLSAGMWCEDFTNATPVRVAAASTGAILNAATQGSVDIWLNTTDIP